MKRLFENHTSLTLLQIGAGAGDQDSRANLRDGFTEFVKKYIDPKNERVRIILVEPNPVNIPFLKECWKDYRQAEIYQLGICLRSSPQKEITFYYAEEDAPHYQVFSMNKEHVEKHYPSQTIKEMVVECVPLEDFIQARIGTAEINLLALDIEGIDAEIILDIDFEKVNCQYISFEWLHLGKLKTRVMRKLADDGFRFVGEGVDYNGYDLLFEKIDNGSKTSPLLKHINSLKLSAFYIKRYATKDLIYIQRRLARLPK